MCTLTVPSMFVLTGQQSLKSHRCIIFRFPLEPANPTRVLFNSIVSERFPTSGTGKLALDCPRSTPIVSGSTQYDYLVVFRWQDSLYEGRSTRKQANVCRK